MDISADGAVVVGLDTRSSRTFGAIAWLRQGHYWYPAEKNVTSQVEGVSADGSTAVGRITQNAVVWKRCQQPVTLPMLPNWKAARPKAVTNGGAVIVGDAPLSTPDCDSPRPKVFHRCFAAVVWLDNEPQQVRDHQQKLVFGRAVDVSEDGRTIVGFDAVAKKAFRMVDGRYSLLPNVTDGTSQAVSVSADGSVIIGMNHTTGVMWQRGQVNTIPPPPGYGIAYPRDASRDGCRVVGYANSRSGNAAFVWTPTRGTRLLADVAREAGVAVPDHLGSATFISADGRTIVGANHTADRQAYHAWALELPPPTECE